MADVSVCDKYNTSDVQDRLAVRKTSSLIVYETQ